MVLVGIPWVFWITTCLWRAASARAAARDGGADWAPGRPAAPVTRVAGGAALEESAVESPGGLRRVRFSAATLMGDPLAGGCSSDTSEGDVVAASAHPPAPNRPRAAGHEGSSLSSPDSKSPPFTT
ncbi:unnamed protein product [Spirodela intermedia]|uniref:Uncharacterized protein n=1 Tax=Spirodela intermedia TaxID=51605 RepID=A0A7I8KGB8_SPIIN|nr:unnamed protein product [Spirodela intermedia]